MWYLKCMSHGAQVSSQCREREMPLTSEYASTPPCDLCYFLLSSCSPESAYTETLAQKR